VSHEASAVCRFFVDDVRAVAPTVPSDSFASNFSAFYTLRREFRLPGVVDHGPAAEEAAWALRSALPEGELQRLPPSQPLSDGAFAFTLKAGARYGTAALAAFLAASLSDRCVRIVRFCRVAPHVPRPSNSPLPCGSAPSIAEGRRNHPCSQSPSHPSPVRRSAAPPPPRVV
jgi:hypothetical protein